MVTIIKKNMKPSEIKDILSKRNLELEKRNVNKLKKHFGTLQRGIDGVEFQNKVRNEWE